MATQTVYQTDPDGYYIGPAVADESPLEPGVFLIPYGAFKTPPPSAPSTGMEWRRVGDAWEEVAMREYAPPPTPQEKLAEFLRNNPDVQALINE